MLGADRGAVDRSRSWSGTPTLRGNEPVNFNILGVAPVVALGDGVQPFTIAAVARARRGAC